MMFLLSLLSLSCAHSSDPGRVPNGANNVPCPSGSYQCVGGASGYCESHGHLQSGSTQNCGGNSPLGNFNAWGVDFYDAGRSWTTSLCTLDSDNDGLSNGDELGDPCCVWTTGATPRRTARSDLSHPGHTSDTSSLPSCKTAPSTPSDPPTTKTKTSSSVTIQWTAPAETLTCVCGFKAQHDSGSGSWTTFYSGPSDYAIREATASGLSGGTSYKFRIVYSNWAGDSAGGAQLTETTTSAQTPGQAPPPCALGASTTSIQLFLQEPTDTGGSVITSHDVHWRSSPSGSPNTVTSVSSPYTKNALSANSVYDFASSPRNSQGPSSTQSSWKSLHTESSGALIPSQPSAPTLISATENSISISWVVPNLNGGLLIKHVVQVKTPTGSFASVSGCSEVCFTSTTCVITGLFPASSYYVRLQTENSRGVSPWSTSALFVTNSLPSCPRNCTGHGICSESFECDCFSGFSGVDCSTSALSPEIVGSDYPFSLAEGPLNFYWRVLEGGDYVEFAASAKRTGYISIGFLGANEKLMEADMVVGWVDSGVVHFYDYNVHDNSAIHLDVEQASPVVAFNGNEQSGITEIKFLRSIAGQTPEDQPIRTGPQTVIWAISDTDPIAPDTVSAHTGEDRGSFQVDLLSGGRVRDGSLLVAHAIFMAVAFVLLLTPGRVIRQFFSSWKKSSPFFVGLNWGGSSVMVFGFFLGLWYVGVDPHFVSLHAVLGIITVVSMVGQALIFTAVQSYDNRLAALAITMRSAEWPMWPHTSHRMLFHTGHVLGLFNILLGMVLADVPIIWIEIYAALLLLLAVLSEIRRARNNRELAKQKREQVEQERLKEIKRMKRATTVISGGDKKGPLPRPRRFSFGDDDEQVGLMMTMTSGSGSRRSRSLPKPPTKKGKVRIRHERASHRAEYDYDAQQGDELSFGEGEELLSLGEEEEGGWMMMRSLATRKEGLVPLTYVVQV